MFAKHSHVFVAIVLLTFSRQEEGGKTQTNPVDQEEVSRLYAFFEETYEAELQRDPMLLSYFGKRDRHEEWGDVYDAYHQKELMANEADLRRLRSEFRFNRLDARSKIAYIQYEYGKMSNIEWNRHFSGSYLDSQQAGEVPWYILAMTNFHVLETVEDAEAYVDRLNDMERVFLELADAIRRRAEAGIVLPSFAYPLVLAQQSNALTGAPYDDGSDHLLLAHLKNKLDEIESDDETAERLIKEAEEALTGPVRRGIEAITAAHTDAMPLSTFDHGVWHLPDGDERYAFLVRYYTESDMSPNEVHALGLSEVARLRAEMELVAEEAGFESFEDYKNFVETDPSQFYDNTDEGRAAFLSDASRIVDEITKKAPEYFGRIPKAKLVVKRTEPFREQGAAFAQYFASSAAGSRPGIYYANLYDMSDWAKHKIEAITYHEGIPGHHFQGALIQESDIIADFQKDPRGNVPHSEGWGLYAEGLAKEMGMYQDSVSEFGRLANEIWRAVRLVVDTGIHHKRWTRDHAIAYMTENMVTSRAHIETELNRYFVIPGQALSYKVGQLRILELRAKAEAELGDRFDIRGFHDAVLGYGTLPLPALDLAVDLYIEETLREE